jgi:hypothetical protein
MSDDIKAGRVWIAPVGTPLEDRDSWQELGPTVVTPECRHPRNQRRMEIDRDGRNITRREICKLCREVVATW